MLQLKHEETDSEYSWRNDCIRTATAVYLLTSIAPLHVSGPFRVAYLGDAIGRWHGTCSLGSSAVCRAPRCRRRQSHTSYSGVHGSTLFGDSTWVVGFVHGRLTCIGFAGLSPS